MRKRESFRNQVGKETPVIGQAAINEFVGVDYSEFLEGFQRCIKLATFNGVSTSQPTKGKVPRK